MASAHTLPLAIDKGLRNGFFRADDPHASGTIVLENKGFAICEVVTATAESRALPAANGSPVGTKLTVILKTDGGNLTITGANVAVVLQDAGQVADFVVADVAGTKTWVLVSGNGVTSVPLNLLTGSAAPGTSLLLGGGTSAAPNTTAVAGVNFVDFRLESTAASGANRAAYIRYEVNGAGNFEAIRGLAVAAGECANVTGGSFGVSVSDTGYVTGSCAAASATLAVANAAVPSNGTYYGFQSSLNGAGSSSSLAAATKYAILGIAATGNASFVTSVKNAIAIDGAAASGGGDMISPGTSMGTVEGTIRILVNGVPKFLPFYPNEGHA